MQKPIGTNSAIVANALAMNSAAERAAYLNEACGADAGLRRRVEALLQAAGIQGRPTADEPEGGTISLRGSTDEVSEALRQELQERLARAGVIVDEARLSHLAYAPEIANAMLQRQQAEAVIAARKRIVEGAVSMVEMALEQLGTKHIVELDEERRAQMVSNLLVVLTSERVAPVINAGTLYA